MQELTNIATEHQIATVAIVLVILAACFGAVMKRAKRRQAQDLEKK